MRQARPIEAEGVLDCSIPPIWRALPDQPMVDGWVRWDAAWYAGIASV